MPAVISGIDSIVVFRNSQGIAGRGTLVHITRTTAVFEIYNPYSIVQLSEVLDGVQILRGERLIYNGRATVSNIVSTGLMTIVYASLLDDWSDLSGIASGDLLQSETRRFINDWELSYDLLPSYQLVVSKIRNFLLEISRWLDGAEAGLDNGKNREESNRIKDEFFHEVQTPVVSKVASLFSMFEEEANKLPEEKVSAHQSFAQRELHPLLLCSPFVHRSYSKPLGFAGDYEMVNMMLRESESECSNTYARIIEDHHIEAAAPEAHRNRIKMLEERLIEEAYRVIREKRPFVVLDVACGPAIELQRFISNESISDFGVFHLMDFSRDAIECAEAGIRKSINESKRRTRVKLILKSIDEFLKEAHQSSELVPTKYDMIYCAGLFDYLTNQTCKSLIELMYEWLRPGGLLTISNVHTKNPNRYQMEHLLEWYLFYRDERALLELAPCQFRKKVETDQTGLNIFLDIRKDTID